MPDRFAAFISYSHTSDAKTGPLLKSALERYPNTWYRGRRRRVYLDAGELVAGLDLRDSIEAALRNSGHLVLIASPDAASSPWVEREVRWWLANRSVNTIMIVLSSGRLEFEETGLVDRSNTNALPEPLVEALTHEPIWVRIPSVTDTEHPEWLNGLADLVAPLDGIDKDTLIGDHLVNRRRAGRLRLGVIGALSVLLVAAIIAASIAFVQRNTAQEQTLLATSRQLVAEASAIRDSQPNLARQLLVQAYRLEPNDRVLGALIESGTMPRVVHTKDLGWQIGVSPKRGLLAVATRSGTILRDPASGTQKVLDTPYATSVSFSPDDTHLAVRLNGGPINIFDITSPAVPELVGSIPTSVTTGSSVLYATPDLLIGEVSATAAAVWSVRDPSRPEVVTSLPAGAAAQGSVVSRDGRLLASPEGNAIVVRDIGDPRSPRQLGVLRGHAQSVNTMTFDTTGRLLVSGSDDDTARLWDLTDPAALTATAVLSGSTLGVAAVALSPDGRSLAVGSGDATIRLWDLSDPVRPAPGAVLTGHTDVVRSLAFTPDGRTLASLSTDGARPADSSDYSNSSLRLWPVSGAQRSSSVNLLTSGAHVAPAFSPDGRYLAGGFPTRIWDVSTGGGTQVVGRVPTVNQGGQAVAFSPDGTQLASGDPLARWDVRDPRQPRLIGSEISRVTGPEVAVYSPDSRTVATGSMQQPVRLWDASGGAEQSSLQGSAVGPQGIAFASDSRRLVTLTDDGLAALWDVTNPRSPVRGASIGDQGDRVTSVAYASDGAVIVTGTVGGTVSVWDVSDPAAPQRASTMRRHAGAVGGLAADSGGDLFATAGEDGVVVIWSLGDAARPLELTTLRTGSIYDAALLAFSRKGALAASSEREFVLFDTDVSGILSRLCAESTPIDQTEWLRYLPAFDYDPPCA